MADFILCRGKDADALGRRLQARLDRAGLCFAPLLQEDSSSLLWRSGGEPLQDTFWQQAEDNWILRSGLFSHRSAAGAPAQKSFFAALDPAAPDLAGTRGQFRSEEHTSELQ